MNTLGQRIAEKLKRKFPLSLAEVDREELVAIISAEIAPLVEALREAQRALEAASKLNTGQDCPDENLSVVVMAGDALDILHAALAGQEPEEEAAKDL